MRKITQAISVLAVTALSVTTVSNVLAHGENSHAVAIGSKGEVAAVARTIRYESGLMNDWIARANRVFSKWFDCAQ